MVDANLKSGGEGPRSYIATRTSTSDLNNWEKEMRYSEKLLNRFQETCTNKFGEHITTEVADVELNKLARLVEMLFPTPEVKK